MKLKGIISTQTDIESAMEEGREGVALIVKEERVVGERRHGNTHLCQVEQVLKRWHLAKKNSVRDTKRGQERRGQMVRITSFTTVRSEHKGV